MIKEITLLGNSFTWIIVNINVYHAALQFMQPFKFRQPTQRLRTTKVSGFESQ